MFYDFDKAVMEWQRVPVDDFDYVDCKELLQLSPEQMRSLVDIALIVRMDRNSWRNRGNKLVEFMNLGSVKDKTVMDFGCGFGLDGALFTRCGARCILADINPWGLMIAKNVMVICSGRNPQRLTLVRNNPPYFGECQLDMFWSFGVLHHTPNIRGILERACNLLNPGGECRICLYSDRRYSKLMGEDAPQNSEGSPRFREFVERCDTVGNYTDWYNADKLRGVVQDFAELTYCEYIEDDNLIAAIIKPKRKLE